MLYIKYLSLLLTRYVLVSQTEQTEHRVFG